MVARLQLSLNFVQSVSCPGDYSDVFGNQAIPFPGNQHRGINSFFDKSVNPIGHHACFCNRIFGHARA